MPSKLHQTRGSTLVWRTHTRAHKRVRGCFIRSFLSWRNGALPNRGVSGLSPNSGAEADFAQGPRRAPKWNELQPIRGFTEEQFLNEYDLNFSINTFDLGHELF